MLALTKSSNAKPWVFVHLRSMALRKEGRKTIWAVVGERNKPEESNEVDRGFALQFRIEPELRTFNELLISRSGVALRRVSFGFGEGTSDAELHFSTEETRIATRDKKFKQLVKGGSNGVSQKVRAQLASARLALGLSARVQQKFSLGWTETSDDLVRPLADEVRYSLQMLMLWSNSFKWRYIETHHSRNRFDALSGLVVTVCSRTAKMSESDVDGIQNVIEENQDELEKLIERKRDLFPKEYPHRMSLPPSSERRLTIKTQSGRVILQGEHLFQYIERLRRALFSSTFEGMGESYSFIFGHPGFVARPMELDHTAPIRLSDIRERREMCEGTLDILNVVDLLDDPPKTPAKLELVPVSFPLWAKKWVDSEQAFAASLEVLSAVLKESVVVGMICRNTMMVYRAGELICVFDGAWREIREWADICSELALPDHVAASNRLKELHRVLARVAYGPASRSILVGFAVDHGHFVRFLKHTEPFGKTLREWPRLDPSIGMDTNLMKASKTDGAILGHTDREGGFCAVSRARVIGRLRRKTPLKGSPSTSGTGDATAQAMGASGTGLVSFKVSRDGGLKVRWNGSKPVYGAATMEGES